MDDPWRIGNIQTYERSPCHTARDATLHCTLTELSPWTPICSRCLHSRGISNRNVHCWGNKRTDGQRGQLNVYLRGHLPTHVDMPSDVSRNSLFGSLSYKNALPVLTFASLLLFRQLAGAADLPRLQYSVISGAHRKNTCERRGRTSS